MLELTTSSPDETRALGAALGASLVPGDLVSLIGELGAGKTTFMQGVAAGWGSADPVTSPTFVLINEYRRSGDRRPDGARLYHMDAYRLSGPAEAADLDIDAYLAAGALVVEWADRIEAALPNPTVSIRIEDLEDDLRKFAFSSPGKLDLEAFLAHRLNL